MCLYLRFQSSLVVVHVALRMQFYRIALCLTYVLLLRRASFPVPFCPPLQSVLRDLWSVSWDWLEDCHNHFCRWKDPDIFFVLSCFVRHGGGVDWSRVAELCQFVCKLWLAHYRFRPCPDSLLFPATIFLRRLLRVYPFVSPDAVDAALHAMARSSAVDEQGFHEHLCGDDEPLSPVQAVDSPWTKRYKRFLSLCLVWLSTRFFYAFGPILWEEKNDT